MHACVWLTGCGARCAVCQRRLRRSALLPALWRRRPCDATSNSTDCHRALASAAAARRRRLVAACCACCAHAGVRGLIAARCRSLAARRLPGSNAELRASAPQLACATAAGEQQHGVGNRAAADAGARRKGATRRGRRHRCRQQTGCACGCCILRRRRCLNVAAASTSSRAHDTVASKFGQQHQRTAGVAVTGWWPAVAPAPLVAGRAGCCPHGARRVLALLRTGGETDWEMPARVQMHCS